MNYQRYLYNLNMAMEAVMANKFRSILTALGIIFGVAAVIAMMAIGNGARQEILDQIKLVGVNNIVIQPVSDELDAEANGEDEGKSLQKKFSPGLTLNDAQSIADIIPTVAIVSPEVVYETFIVNDGKRSAAKLTGVTPDFFRIFNLEIERGTMFNFEQLEQGEAVCIIGPALTARFFSSEDPIGKYIKCGNIWLKVVGVLKKVPLSNTATEDLGISNYNENIYAPIQTVLLRFKDRSVISSASLHGSTETFVGDGFMSIQSSGGSTAVGENQLDRIVVQVNDSKDLSVTASILQRMLLRRHQGKEDVEIKVPELLLKQEQKTKDIFNIVLGAIASISLIVGGIGIMNIMLASVMERIKEIGTRRAIGATRKDIIFQFLSEATIISITGGLIGIALGIGLAKIIMHITDILTIVSLASILISFGVSATVGIAFGYMPARKAAAQDPVQSLRHD
ncbi:MAG: ABC transporter permease [Bacteroidales bacterium]